MTRFDAKTSADRQALFTDAIAAHRARASAYLTIEVDVEVVERTSELDPALGTPWVQFADGIVNLDCTEREFDRCESVLEAFPAFSVADLTRPDEPDEHSGTESPVNVRIRTVADDDRIGQFLDALLEETYDLPADYRAWVVEV